MRKLYTFWESVPDFKRVPDEVYQPADDAAHPSPAEGYFEWWYLDASFDSGHTFSASIQARNFMNPGHPNPFIMLNVTTPEGKMISRGEAYEFSDFKAALDHCSVRMGKNRLEKEGKGLRLQVEIHDLKADLVFTPNCPSWKPGCGKIRFDDGEKHFGWNVNMPGAEVRGTLGIKGSETAVSGAGYHDHNFGNCNMAEFFPRWYWGRFSAGKYIGVFADVYGDEGFGAKHSRPFLIARSDEVVLSTEQVDFIPEYFKYDPRPKRDYPTVMTMKVYGGSPVTVRIFNSVLMESRFVPADTIESLGYKTEQVGMPAYVRMNAECVLELPFEKEPITGKVVHELMVFR
ncbi:MAG: hypothetical protein HPY50_08585 [Firmicutes bacterium]|nr:hypothetical protein [Bacillota bacterium]